MISLTKIKNNKFLTYVFFAIITTIVNVGVYMLVYRYITNNVCISNIFAYVCSITFSFVINKKIVFKKRGNVLIQIILYLLVKLISFSIDTSLLIILKEYFHIDNFVAKIIANASTTISNYILNNKLVFKSNTTH